jgi:hypothetical protein
LGRYLELGWEQVAELRVPALPVVEDLDVVEHRVCQLDPGSPLLAVEQFDLHAGPERFDHDVAQPVADGAEGGHKSG